MVRGKCGLGTRSVLYECTYVEPSSASAATYAYCFPQAGWVVDCSRSQYLCFVCLCAELEGLAEPTFAADWWSLGAILFEILTGQVLKLLLRLSYM